MEFRRTDIISYNKAGKPLTDEELRWKRFAFPSTIKESAPITYVHSLCTNANIFAVTCANKVKRVIFYLNPKKYNFQLLPSTSMVAIGCPLFGTGKIILCLNAKSPPSC